MSYNPPVLIANRLFNSSWVALADDDVDVSDWSTDDEFIVGFQLDEVKGPWNAQYKLRWRKSGGTWADLASTGAIKWGTGTSLVNGDPVTARKLQATGGSGSTWQNGEQVEGASTCDSIDLADEYYTEVHFACDPADAEAAAFYEFEIYDATNGAPIDTGLAGVTIAAGLPDVSESAEPVLEMEGSLNRQLIKPVSSLIEAEVLGTRGLTFPLSSLVEMEVSLTRKSKFLLSALVESEASLTKKLEFPLSSLVEVEAIGTVHVGLDKSAIAMIEVEALGTKELILPLTSTVEMEVVGTVHVGLNKSIDVTLNVESAGTRKLKIPLSSVIEMEASGARKLNFPLSSIVEVEATLDRGTTFALSSLIELGSEGPRKLGFALLPLIETEVTGTRMLVLPLSSTMEMEVLAGKQWIKPAAALIEVEAYAVTEFVEAQDLLISCYETISAAEYTLARIPIAGVLKIAIRQDDPTVAFTAKSPSVEF